MLAINKKVKFSLLAGCATFVISSMVAAPLAHAQSFGNSIIDAAENGNVSQVFTLVGMGQDVNAVGRFGVTALHRAAYNDAVDVGQALIESGASLNPKDAGGATPLHIAARMGNVDFIQLLAKNNVDINSRDNEGFTALQRAVASDNSTAAVTLVAFGADANIANNAGQTALSTATERNDQTVLRAINSRTAAATGVKIPATRSDVIAAPVTQVSEGDVAHIDSELNKPIIVTARHDTAPANQFDSNLHLKQEAPMLQLPAEVAPVPATIPVALPVASSITPVNPNLPKSMQSSYSGHSAVTAPIAPLPAPQVIAAPVEHIEPIELSQPELPEATPIAVLPTEQTSWNTSSESQIAQISAPGYNNVINLDRSAEGVRANGILVSQGSATAASAPVAVTAPEPVSAPALAPVPLTVIDTTSASSPAVEIENLAAPIAEIPAVTPPAAIQPEATIIEKKDLDPKLPKSMQKRTSFNEVEAAPAIHNLQPVIAPTVPVEGLEKQPIVMQETVTVKSADNEILKQETTTTKFDAAPIAPLAPVVPASQIQKPSSEFIAPAADPLEKRVETLINEPLNFDKYNTGVAAGSQQKLGYNETLEQLENRRLNGSTEINNNAAIGAAAVGVAAGAVGAAAINAANDDWGGLSDSDIDRLDKEIKSKTPSKKAAAKKVEKAKKVAEVKADQVESDLASINAETSNKAIEETLNKQFDEVKAEVAPVKLPDEKQSDAGKATLVATNKNKIAEVAHVSEEELKAPEVPAEIAAPALPSFDTPIETNINKDVPKPEAEIKATAELPKLPDLNSASAKGTDALSDKDFESKLKSIEAKAAEAPKKEEFNLNESVSSTELEAEESKNAPKSVFDDIKKMSEEAAKAEIYAVIGTFPNTDAASKHYNNIAGKTGLVFPYKVSKSATDSKTYLQIGPVEDIRITDEICASFAVESKTCRVPSISDEDKKFLKGLKAVNSKNVYSLIGDFSTEKEAKDFYQKVSTEKSLNFKYSITKTSKGGVFGLQVGPLVSGGESKDVCDAFKSGDKNCVVSVK